MRTLGGVAPVEVQVEGGDPKAAARVAPGLSGGEPGRAARAGSDPDLGPRPPYGLGPVARTATAVYGSVSAAVARAPVAGGPASRPMSPPIARAMRRVVALATPTNGNRADPQSPLGRGGPRPSGPGTLSVGRGGFGLPNLRRNVCPHFYLTGVRGAMPVQAPHLLKALVRQEQNISRCQLRGGVHLEQGYVNDVCLSARFNQCVFYEDDLGS